MFSSTSYNQFSYKKDEGAVSRKMADELIKNGITVGYLIL